MGFRGIAHKFMPSNDFRDLTALSRNFFRSPSVSSSSRMRCRAYLLRHLALEDSAAPQPLRFVRRRGQKRAKAKRIFRDAKRNVSHLGS